MSKNTFKQGDHVRRTNYDNDKAMPVGSEWVVIGQRGNMTAVEGFDNGQYSSFSVYFELVEQPKLKVGDRVRFIRDSTCGGAHIGYRGELASVISARQNTGTVTLKLDTARCGFNPAAHVCDLELVKPLVVAPKVNPILSVKVSSEDASKVINEALTAYVKDVLGIDATVTRIIRDFGVAVELVLAQEVN